MQVIAVTNIKGVVGRTMASVNLACLATQSGRATVSWDLDPQGAATCTLHIEPNEQISARKLTRSCHPCPRHCAHGTHCRNPGP